MPNNICVIDIGGTNLKYGFIDESQNTPQIYEKEEIKVPQTKEELYSCIQMICQKKAISGVAVSMPGLIDSVKKINYHGGALTYIREISVESELTDLLQLSVKVENDGKCAALGESRFGVLQGCDSGVVIVLGTAVGGGLIIDGKLWRGHHFSAGEFSFINVNNPQQFLPSNMFAYHNGVGVLLKEYEQVTSKKLDGRAYFNEVNHGDAFAYQVLKKYCQSLVNQIYNLQMILDPARIVIGGGISQQKILFEVIDCCLKEKYYEIEQTLGMEVIKPVIMQSKLGNEANLYGAYSYFLEGR